MRFEYYTHFCAVMKMLGISKENTEKLLEYAKEMSETHVWSFEAVANDIYCKVCEGWEVDDILKLEVEE